MTHNPVVVLIVWQSVTLMRGSTVTQEAQHCITCVWREALAGVYRMWECGKFVSFRWDWVDDNWKAHAVQTKLLLLSVDYTWPPAFWTFTCLSLCFHSVDPSLNHMKRKSLRSLTAGNSPWNSAMLDISTVLILLIPCNMLNPSVLTY